MRVKNRVSNARRTMLFGIFQISNIYVFPVYSSVFKSALPASEQVPFERL